MRKCYFFLIKRYQEIEIEIKYKMKESVQEKNEQINVTIFSHTNMIVPSDRYSDTHS